MTEITSSRDVHLYFGLTYASYLVLPRTLLQSMPGPWQERFVAMLEEMDSAFDPVPHYGRGRTRIEPRGLTAVARLAAGNRPLRAHARGGAVRQQTGVTRQHPDRQNRANHQTGCLTGGTKAA